MKIVQITPSLRREYQSRIAGLEKLASYPLGKDSFQIDHGADYFAFFDRMGFTKYFIALDGDSVVAVAAGVLREASPRAWYLCDLKVHPDYRHQRIPLRMLGKAFLPNYLKCRNGYAISMNPSDGSPNRVVKLLRRFRWAPNSLATTLSLFSLDADTVTRVRPVIEKHRGTVSFLSLKGKKDLILKSTGQTMPLLHFQFGESRVGRSASETRFREPQAGFTHMLSCPESDPLRDELRSLGYEPTATASVIHHGMRAVDWNFILTSEI